MNDEQSMGHQSVVQEKDFQISMLQGELKMKNGQINELAEEIEMKARRIADMQS